MRRPRCEFRVELLEQRSLLTVLTVTTRFDLMDPGDGVLSLREALVAAADETANPGHDTITFDANLGSGMIHADYGGFNVMYDQNLGKDILREWYAPNSGGQFVIDSNLTIDGSVLGLVRIGHERGWAERHRIFQVNAGVSATFQNLVIQGGDSNNAHGAGINNAGELRLIDSVVGSNYALGDAGGNLKGGGIYNAATGTLRLERTHVGEVALDDGFLAGIGFSGDFFANDEASERTRFSTLVYRGGSVVGKSTSDATQISGNGSYGPGGGIYNDGMMFITGNSVIRGNRTVGFNSNGAGIFNAGTLTIEDSGVDSQTRWGNNSGTAYGSTGAGIYNTGTLTIARSTFRNNATTTQGGAIYNAGVLTVSDTTFELNLAAKDADQTGLPNPRGGAIYDAGTSTLLQRSTFSDGTAFYGAAIVNDNNPDQVLDRVTIANNSGNHGGALDVLSGLTTIVDSTIAHNTTVTSGGGIRNLGSVVLQNSIVADNTSPSGPDISSTGTLTSQGHNLIQSASGYVFSNGNQVSDLTGIPAFVGPLGNYGGATQTVGLLPASPAIDSGRLRPGNDQRHESGLVGRQSDRGAFESVPPAKMRVDSLDDVSDGFYGDGEFSLREAIQWANQLPGADEISFSADLQSRLTEEPGTMELALREFTITDDLSIYGPGADKLTIDANGLSRAFTIASGVTVEFVGMKLTGGRGVDRGGAILSEGSLTLSRMHITGNEVIAGPDNQGYGGAVINNGGTLHVDSSTIDNNFSPSNGGGISNWGAASIVNSTLSGNTAGFGGGIHTATGSLLIESSTITANHAATRGGGFRRFPASALTIQNSIIAGNTSPDGPDGRTDPREAIAGSHNVIGIGDAAGFTNGVNSNQVGTTATPLDPLLGRLRNLGGPTPVHGLLPGSPALEASNPTDFPRFDQRGLARPIDVLPDIGAFEFVAPILSNPVVVDSLDGESDGAFGPGQMSLTEAILFTNADPNLTSIVFDAGLFSGSEVPAVIQLIDTQLLINGDVVINGPGANRLEIQGAGPGYGVFYVSNAFARIRDLKVSRGQAAFGGALRSFHAYIILDRVFLSNNSAQYGGAIYNGRFSTLVVNESTVANNQALFWGGGLQTDGMATLTNVTISRNTATHSTGGAGGGIHSGNGRPDLSGSGLTLIHTTVTNNSAAQGGGIFNDTPALLTLGNSLIAGNMSASAPDIYDAESTITSQGGNIVGNNQSLLATMHASDQVGTPAAPVNVFMTDLVTIGDTVMPIHGLLPEPGGNSAVDHGLAANGVAADQRGVSRPYGGGYDVGAFELGATDWQAFVFNQEIVVDNVSDELDGYYGPGGMTFREAVMITNVFNATAPTVIDGVSYDRIRFDAGVLGAAGQNPRVTLTRGQLDILGNLVITSMATEVGPSILPTRVTIDGNRNSHTLDIRNNVSVRISDVNITGGRADQSPMHTRGGGIKTTGNLWLTRVDVFDNFAADGGGGIYSNSSDVWLTDVVLRNNSARYGGGVSLELDHSLTMVRSSVFENSAVVRGGGMDVIGALTIRNSAIYENSSNLGGGFFSYYRDGLVENSTISGNTAASGGALGRGSGGKLRFVNTTISNNTATTNAGGINNSGTIEFVNTILAGNHSNSGPDALNTYRMTSLGHNIFGNTSQFANPGGPFGGGSFTSAPGDLLNTNAQLAPLGNNGGATLTHPLLPTSPAIDAGAEEFTPLMDQRGFPVTDIDGVGTGIPDIGAYEIQSVGGSAWHYQALDRNQFGPGEALSFGFGYDDGKDGNSVRSDPYFLGFQFDTGQLKFGDIVDGPFGTKFGGEVQARFAGRLGFEIGFYVNAGSVDVEHYGNANYVIDPGANGSAVVSTYIDVNDGGLYTVSPKIGAYADLVVKLDADVSARAALFGVVGADLIDIHVDTKTEMFSLNRQLKDQGRPMFLTDTGLPVSRNAKTGQFYSVDVTPQPISDPGLIIPLLDGDIRYFSLGIEEVAKGVIEAARDARDLVNHYKAVRELSSANSEVADSTNERERLNKQLEVASDKARRSTSLTAQQELTDLAGPDYAAAVAQGKKGSELPDKQGKIRDAEDSLVRAEKKRSEASAKVKKSSSKRLKKAGVGVVIDTGKVTGGLLGAEVKIGVGASIGLASLTKNVGTLQVTLPDVNLRDSQPDALGNLAASTSDFARNSTEDLKRQIASAKVDLGAFIPGFPGGTYNVSLGPFSLDVTTVSYNVGPQLNVTQDVQAQPVKVDQGLTYEFFKADGTTPESAVVTINGVLHAGGSSVHSVSFNEGDRVEVAGVDRDNNGQHDQIVVKPTLTIGSRFSNDIGLDMDLDGAFKAFGLSLSALGTTLVDIGPLLKHNHTFHTFDLGSVFNKSFNLGNESLPLEPFILFNATAVGRTPATAYRTQPKVGNANISTTSVDAPVQVPVFVTVDQLSQANPDMAYTVLDISAVSGGTISTVEVLDERLMVSGGTGGTPFRITGFTPAILESQASVLFAVRFSGAASGEVVQVTRSNPISLSASRPSFGSNSSLISETDFEQVGASAVLSNDIDGDGLSLPETDGVLMIRHLAGFTGAALVAGALGNDATRTDPEDIAAYISELLDQALPPDRFGTTISTLDFDGDGGRPTALGDGVLLTRYLDGRRDAALVGGVVGETAARQTGEDIVAFIEVGRASANDPAFTDFDQVKARNGADVFGLAGKLDADPNAVAGSSATAALGGTQSSEGGGNGPEFGQQDSAGPSYVFDLTAFGLVVDFEELYTDLITPANLISRIAVGSPTDFANASYRPLLTSGGDTLHLVPQTVSAVLGIDEPLYIKAPDAGGYEYVASPGFNFTSVTIDPQIGGNQYQLSEFDLYLFDEGTQRWKFDRLLTTADATQVLPNGQLHIAFVGEGVSAFRLYPLPLPNRELHDEVNLTLPHLEFSTGLTLEAAPGVTGQPMITMTQLAEREPFGDPAIATVINPVFTSDSAAVTTNFVIRRDLHEQVITTTTSGIGMPTVETRVLTGSTQEIRLNGDDGTSDTATLDLTDGPLRAPIRFNGGFRIDTLKVSGNDGIVDLIDRSNQKIPATLEEADAANVQLSEVEVVDLRGVGNITLLVNAASVISNDPQHSQLIVRRDAGDAIPLDIAWQVDGQTTLEGVTYDRFVQGKATILLEALDVGGIESGGDGGAAGGFAAATGPATTPSEADLAAFKLTTPKRRVSVASIQRPRVPDDIFAAFDQPETVVWGEAVEAGRLLTSSLAPASDDGPQESLYRSSATEQMLGESQAFESIQEAELNVFVDEVFSELAGLLLNQDVAKQ